MKKVITMVGTSLFENYFDKDKNSKINNSIKSNYSQLKKNNPPHCQWDKYKSDREPLRQLLLKWSANDQSSAEIKSLLKIQSELKDNLDVYLLATDTVLSRLAAEIIRDRFNSQTNCQITVKDVCVIDGLRIDKPTVFKETGLPKLLECINKIQPDCLNITGGYKGVIPYLTIFGQVKNIPTVYIYEDADELIEIPQLPIDFDFSIIEDNYYAFEELARNPYKEKLIPLLAVNREQAEIIFNSLLTNQLIRENLEGKIEFTVWGKLLFKHYAKDTNYRDLIGNIVELKLFKYFVEKGCKNVKHSNKELENGSHKAEIDVYFENEDGSITAIEVKPGGNVPIWEEKEKNESFEYKLTKGSFAYLRKKYSNPVIKIVLYSPNEIVQSPKDQIQKMCKEYKIDWVEWLWLKVHKDYKTKIDWNIADDSLKNLFEKN